MKHFTRHKLSGARAERSNFRHHLQRDGRCAAGGGRTARRVHLCDAGRPPADQNAEDILAMQVENRSRYIRTTLKMRRSFPRWKVRSTP